MATYLSNRDSDGKTNEQGHYRFNTNLWQGNIQKGFSVIQNTTPGMNVIIKAGDIKIDYQTYAYTAWADADEVLSIPTADTVNRRIDRIVAYIDRGMTFSSGSVNNPGALKFKVAQGVPSSSPFAVSDTAVQSSVGADNPWCELAQITVSQSVSQILNASILDKRKFIKSSSILEMIYPVGSIYLNASISTNPALLFEFGTWSAWGTGRMPVGFDVSQTEFNTIEKTGGAKTHTLVQAELPLVEGTWNHTAGGENASTGVISTVGGYPNVAEGSSNGTQVGARRKISFGSNQPHNNLSPYITVYMWKRIS